MRFVMLLFAAAMPATAGAVDVCLRWTAPGDDGNIGQASHYEVRYHTVPITEANWVETYYAQTTPETPSPVGQLDSCVVTGLAPDTDYWFALKAADENYNWSALSNVVYYHTGDTTAPAAVVDLQVDSLCVPSR
ncbi:MAG TPA: fibronectin type III domain-containing protein [Myxococcota bacterium]|jgi:phosphodiesterase/alkaline phosphatase D-like protein|nr:fibronectin type III domain-containing protein [Myxococcota bacterium]